MFTRSDTMDEGQGYEIQLYDDLVSLDEVSHSVAILLPTYCEAENIEDLILEIQELELDPLIVVMDDSSPDGTSHLVAGLQEQYGNILLLLRPTKLGLGTAITAGFRFLLSLPKPPHYIVTMDADYSHNPQDIPRLIEAARRGNDLVIGSRYCPGGEILGWHIARLLISRCANLIASTVVGMRLHDCTSGFRCYTSRYVKDALENLHSQTYEIQIETVKQARTKGFPVKEVPITFVNRKRGKSKLTRNEIQS
ncbi:glycosyltransferase, partial [Candidatus Bathyarchaeota archaeon]|nr:polyprenol monophosphomannose synthase [Candidatus Bathyarchaeota archaeon]NIR17702.1 polyprenol monophosphomannose synthase [Desulfobacterales bacterium]NIU81398.1 glycosyltransferase [Candidatus Bathyarchaeota archaeon]NIV67259.1 glycosyltransferase [Candidatus Bathyarchaeota archaeon]NIW33956.1 glycosyltransferase [Candidatus Bathyarchaeota archaeon]